MLNRSKALSIIAALALLAVVPVSDSVGQGAGQPVIVLNGGVAVSNSNPLPVAASGGGGGAVTIADGADVAEGAKADAAYTGSGSASVVSILKGLYAGVTGSVPTGTNVIGKTGIDQTTPGTTNAVQHIPGTSGGLTVYFVQPTASDNHVNIKNGAGQVYKITITNNSATINYVRLYNAASGFNGCNSATNLVYKALIQGNSTNGGGLADYWGEGIAFSTGISICVTSGYATNDTTNATASAMDVNIGYK